MDDKTLTAVATSLALMQIQSQCLMLWLERHIPGAPIPVRQTTKNFSS